MPRSASTVRPSLVLLAAAVAAVVLLALRASATDAANADGGWEYARLETVLIDITTGAINSTWIEGGADPVRGVGTYQHLMTQMGATFEQQSQPRINDVAFFNFVGQRGWELMDLSLSRVDGNGNLVVSYMFRRRR
jgi:hypothetical protein